MAQPPSAVGGGELGPAAGRTVAWVFPGQGSQYVGMGKAVARVDVAAGAVFTAADETLGFGLSDLVFNGPEEALRQTSNQQPAILATSIAYFVALQSRGLLPPPAFVAGHSLGEYAALVAAGALDLADAIRLVRRRGELMDVTSEGPGDGAMAALIGLPIDEVAAIAAAVGAEVANENAPDQTTVSGRRDAVERAMTLAKERGARRAILLPVSAAFHSSLMAPAADGMRPLLAEVPLGRAAVPLVANVDARPIQEPDELRRELLDQILAPVRWTAVVGALATAGVTTYYEVGPGKVLAGLIGRTHRGATTITAESLLGAVTTIEEGRTGG